VLPVFWFGDWTVSLDPWLRVSTGKQVSLPSLFSWSGSYENSSSLSPSSSSPIQSCDHACSALPPVACSRWIAASAVQWWRFSRISENLLEICANFVWILLLLSSVSRIPWWIQSFFAKSFWIGAGFELGFMRVLEFLWILWFWSVTAKREKMDSVCVMWREFCGFLTLFTIYKLHVASEPMRFWHVDLDACVAFGLLLLKDQSAKKNNETDLQT